MGLGELEAMQSKETPQKNNSDMPIRAYSPFALMVLGLTAPPSTPLNRFGSEYFDPNF